MTQREKTIVYGSLTLLVICNIIVLLGSSGRAAFAEMAQTLASLGPAKSVTLVDDQSKDSPEVVLRNDKGRLGWNDGEFARTHSVAYVHIGDILSTLMESGTYTDEREALKEELAERDEQMNQKWQEFQEQYGEITPDDPNFEQARQAYQQLQQQMQQWQQERQRRQSRLTAEQLERAYRELVGAVKTVADEHHIDVVYRFIPTDDPFETERADEAMENIRLRPVLKYPDALDISPEVRDELAL